jgi:hypothetical protein
MPEAGPGDVVSADVSAVADMAVRADQLEDDPDYRAESRAAVNLLNSYRNCLAFADGRVYNRGEIRLKWGGAEARQCLSSRRLMSS